MSASYIKGEQAGQLQVADAVAKLIPGLIAARLYPKFWDEVEALIKVVESYGAIATIVATQGGGHD